MPSTRWAAPTIRAATKHSVAAGSWRNKALLVSLKSLGTWFVEAAFWKEAARTGEIRNVNTSR